MGITMQTQQEKQSFTFVSEQIQLPSSTVNTSQMAESIRSQQNGEKSTEQFTIAICLYFHIQFNSNKKNTLGFTFKQMNLHNASFCLGIMWIFLLLYQMIMEYKIAFYFSLNISQCIFFLVVTVRNCLDSIKVTVFKFYVCISSNTHQQSSTYSTYAEIPKTIIFL